MSIHEADGPAKEQWVRAGSTGIERARRLMFVLRGPGGCPWDNEQTHSSLRKYLLEESYELADLLDQNDIDDKELKNELGDVLLQVLFHARLAEERNSFDLNAVGDAIAEKMIKRHPHVFGDAVANTSDDVMANWERNKRADQQKEKQAKQSFGKGLSQAMPALTRAQTLGSRASQFGFDWPDGAGAMAKVVEEVQELQQELDSGGSKERIEEELGDVLFALTNIARHYGLDAEQSAKKAANKFAARFNYVLDSFGDQEISRDLQELEDRWQQAKAAFNSPDDQS